MKLLKTLFIGLCLSLTIAESALAQARCQSVFAADFNSSFMFRSWQIAAGNGRVTDNLHRAPLTTKALSKLARFYNGPVRLTLPFPFFEVKNRTASVFDKQWKDFSYSPTEDEALLLMQHSAYETFMKRKNFLQKNPRTMTGRKYLNTALALYLLAHTTMLINQTYEMEQNTVSLEQYLGEDDFVNGVMKVQLVVETTPFPHTAIRMGPKIYSYGIDAMEAVPKDVYFFREKTNSLALLKPVDPYASWIPASRAVRVIDINLAKDEAITLRNRLELNTGKKYLNRPLVNDCSTMIARLLKDNESLGLPKMIDPFPSTTTAFLSLRHTLGDKRVGKVQLVITDSRESKVAHLMRNAMIASIESRIMLINLPLFLPHRTVIDLMKDDEELQYYDAATELKIKDWQHSIDQLLKEDLEFLDGMVNSHSFTKQEKFARLDEAFNQRIIQTLTVFTSDNAEFRDLIIAQYTTDWLVQKKTQLMMQIESQ